jgi:hypothetical protein
VESIDIDVHWTIVGQLRIGSRQLAPGSNIHSLSEGS